MRHLQIYKLFEKLSVKEIWIEKILKEMKRLKTNIIIPKQKLSSQSELVIYS